MGINGIIRSVTHIVFIHKSKVKMRIKWVKISRKVDFVSKR